MGDVPLLGENEGVAQDRRPQEGGERMTQDPTPRRGEQLPSEHPLMGLEALEHPDCAADVPLSVKDALERRFAGSVPPPEPVPDDVELV
jgi:hypothetical protein